MTAIYHPQTKAMKIAADADFTADYIGGVARDEFVKLEKLIHDLELEKEDMKLTIEQLESDKKELKRMVAEASKKV